MSSFRLVAQFPDPFYSQYLQNKKVQIFINGSTNYSVFIHTTAWMNLRNVLLNEEKPKPKPYSMA